MLMFKNNDHLRRSYLKCAAAGSSCLNKTQVQTYDPKHHNLLRHKMSNKVSNKVSKENYNLTENPNPTKYS